VQRSAADFRVSIHPPRKKIDCQRRDLCGAWGCQPSHLEYPPTCDVLPVWCRCHHPSIRIICVSADAQAQGGTVLAAPAVQHAGQGANSLQQFGNSNIQCMCNSDTQSHQQRVDTKWTAGILMLGLHRTSGDTVPMLHATRTIILFRQHAASSSQFCNDKVQFIVTIKEHKKHLQTWPSITACITHLVAGCCATTVTVMN
jgi:hypothetical protein